MEKIKQTTKLVSRILLPIIIITIVPWLVFMFCSYILPNPPKPEITYSEFPIHLVYEFGGETIEIEETYVCEFDGFDFTAATGEKYRKWRGYLKSGKTRITLGEIGAFEIFCFAIDSYGSIMAGRYMGDPDYPGEAFETHPSICYTSNFEYDAIGDVLKDNEAWEQYKVRIISWECSPPIKNSFH